VSISWSRAWEGAVGSGWMKSLLTGRKSESALSDSARKQLHYILSSAPTWDRSIIVRSTLLDENKILGLYGFTRIYHLARFWETLNLTKAA
jgi:hypothetical protein